MPSATLTETAEFYVLVRIASQCQKRCKDVHQTVLVRLVWWQASLQDDYALQEAIHVVKEDDDDIIVC
jgi:hypothetical protein